MWKLILACTLAIGCSQSEVASCVVLCTSDPDCPDGQTCGEVGYCTAGQACPCNPGRFYGCANTSTSDVCNGDGDGRQLIACGGAGCNADAGRCNECTPGQPRCRDSITLEDCGPNGLPSGGQTCPNGCEQPATADPAHCKP